MKEIKDMEQGFVSLS